MYEFKLKNDYIVDVYRNHDDSGWLARLTIIPEHNRPELIGQAAFPGGKNLPRAKLKLLAVQALADKFWSDVHKLTGIVRQLDAAVT